MVARCGCELPKELPVSGEMCIAIATDQGTVANYQNNPQLIDWVNNQPLASPLTCLADGHSGGMEHRAADCDSRAAT